MAVSYIGRSTTCAGGGGNALYVNKPSSYQNDDLLILFCGTENEPISTPSGWTLLSYQGNGTQNTSGATRITIFYKIASGTIPDFYITCSGLVYAMIAVFRGSSVSDPFITYSGRNQTSATTTYTGNTLTTTRDACMIVDFAGLDQDANTSNSSTSWSNSSLASITRLYDQTQEAWNGGGVMAAYGIKTSAGSVSATTATINSQLYSSITVAIQPPNTTENHTGAVSLTQASTVSALGTMGAKGAVSVSQASTVSAIGKKAVSGAVSVAQASTTTIVGTRSEATNDKTGSVSVTQASEVAILGKVGLNGAVSVSQGSSVAVSGKLGAKGSVSVAQGSSVSALGTMGAKGSVSVADASSVAISGTKFVQTYEFFGRLDVAQTSNASVSGKKSVSGAVNVYQVSAVHTSGKKNSSGSFSLAQASSVSIFGFRTIVKAFSLSSTVNLVRTRNGSLNGTKKHTSVYRNSKSLSSVLNDTYRKETKI